MEHKKAFGSFILQRRKELGMTRKDFACPWLWDALLILALAAAALALACLGLRQQAQNK